jgi:hypothetical protein
LKNFIAKYVKSKKFFEEYVSGKFIENYVCPIETSHESKKTGKIRRNHLSQNIAKTENRADINNSPGGKIPDLAGAPDAHEI